MNITVIGANYIGLPLAVLLAQENNVYIIDSKPEKIAKINKKESPIKEKAVEKYLNMPNCHLQAIQNSETAFKDAECVIIATETFYDPLMETFDVCNIFNVTCRIHPFS